MNVYKLPASRGLLTADDLAHLKRNDLLSEAKSNPKMAKGLGSLPIRSVGLNLAPAWNSGYNMCPMASPGCAGPNGCFFHAPTTYVRTGVNPARIRKTRYFVEAHQAFMRQLVKELEREVRLAARDGVLPVVRLNVMSDVEWERVPCTRGGVTYPGVPQAFPEIQFYDYTKMINRLRRGVPDNYRLTFSLSETNDSHALEALQLGFNVAAVIRVKKGRPFAATFAGYQLIDGDVHDYRYLDPRGVIVGLRPKGFADQDTSGFVREPDAMLEPARKLAFHTKPALVLAQVA